MKLTAWKMTLGFASLAALSACATSSGPDYALQCMFEVDAPGEYEYAAGVLEPTVFPSRGGTQAGADAINACIVRKANDARIAATTRTGQQVQTTASGDRVVRTVTYGTPPQSQRRTSGGSLPLPTQYPLQPGDEALWPTLTIAQQQRALLFLESGSTIRSSLAED